MGLFNKKERYELQFTRNFRGFKHINVVVYGNEEAMKNNEMLYTKDLKGSTCYFDGTQLYLNDLLVGAIFDEEIIKLIKTGKITQICAKPKENDNRLKFFVKIDE